MAIGAGVDDGDGEAPSMPTPARWTDPAAATDGSTATREAGEQPTMIASEIEHAATEANVNLFDVRRSTETPPPVRAAVSALAPS